jgi:hypothetical protein
MRGKRVGNCAADNTATNDYDVGLIDGRVPSKVSLIPNNDTTARIGSLMRKARCAKYLRGGKVSGVAEVITRQIGLESMQIGERRDGRDCYE